MAIKAILLDLGNVVAFFDKDRQNPSPALEQFERGEIRKREYHYQINGRMPATEFWRIHNDLFTPNVEMIRLLKQLKSSIELIAFSNTDPIRGGRMIELSELDFSKRVMSYLVGAMKPEAPMFEAGISAASVKPSEILYFDDILAYCDAAQNHGIQTHHFRSVELAERELTKRELLKERT